MIPATVIPHESALKIRDAMRYPAADARDAAVYVRFTTQHVRQGGPMVKGKGV